MPFYWTELNTREPDRAKSFYAATMGWSFRDVDGDADYCIVMKGERIIGGIYHMRDKEFEDVPSHWFSYVEVDDVDAACATAVAAGGVVLREPMTIPQVGRIAILRDPVGSPIGCIAPERGRIELAA